MVALRGAMLCSHRWARSAVRATHACRSLHKAPIRRCRAEPQRKDAPPTERLRALLRERWAEVAKHERVLAVMVSTALMERMVFRQIIIRHIFGEIALLFTFILLKMYPTMYIDIK